MATHDIRNNIGGFKNDIVAIASNTTTTLASIDTKDMTSVCFLLGFSAYTDGSYAFSIEESSDNGAADAWAAIDAEKLLAPADGVVTLAADTADNDAMLRLGAFSTERYLRISVVSTGVTTGATVASVVVGEFDIQPDERANIAP